MESMQNSSSRHGLSRLLVAGISLCIIGSIGVLAGAAPSPKERSLELATKEFGGISAVTIEDKQAEPPRAPIAADSQRTPFKLDDFELSIPPKLVSIHTSSGTEKDDVSTTFGYKTDQVYVVLNTGNLVIPGRFDVNGGTESIPYKQARKIMVESGVTEVKADTSLTAWWSSYEKMSDYELLEQMLKVDVKGFQGDLTGVELTSRIALCAMRQSWGPFEKVSVWRFEKRKWLLIERPKNGSSNSVTVIAFNSQGRAVWNATAMSKDKSECVDEAISLVLSEWRSFEKKAKK